MRKKIFTVLGIFLVVGVIFIWFVVTGGVPRITNNINDYGEFRDFAGYSDLLIFPKQGTENIEEYYYYYRDTLFDPTCQIYLKCQYDKDSFGKEIERLKDVEVLSSRGEEHRLLQNEVDYNYLAFIASNGFEGCHEYALLDYEEMEIIYIYLQGISESNIKFESQYLPNNYKEYGTLENTYNLYAFKNPYSDLYEWELVAQ